MPSFGGLELAIILLIVIAIFGVGKLPQVGSALGKSIKEFRESIKEDDSSDG
ncbi:MAG: twin-arginine translocase TatA/TatE family subunit [Chloroflexota bacterium]